MRWLLVGTGGSPILGVPSLRKRIDQLWPLIEYDGIIYLKQSSQFHSLLWSDSSLRRSNL